MSKYLAFSFMIVTLVVGIIGGYAAANRTNPSAPTVEESKFDSKPSGMSTAEMVSYSDQDYLAEMIIHHEDAIAMSENVLKHTSRKEVKDLANTIISAQSQEIKQMKQWLMDWQ